MKLYDEVIGNCLELFGQNKQTVLRMDRKWEEVSDRSMILRSDMAYELGSDGLPAIGCTLITGNNEFVKEDGITLIGENLSEINNNQPYGRVAIVRVDENVLSEGEALYRTIRNLEYTRYHFYPKGFMMRVSASKQKECVRVGRTAIEEGLSFEKTGTQLIEAFHKHSLVKAVSIYYITDREFDYGKLEKYAREGEAITKTIDHISNNAIMDCSACNLQQVCDEVEGLRELHFSH